MNRGLSSSGAGLSVELLEPREVLKPQGFARRGNSTVRVSWVSCKLKIPNPNRDVFFSEEHPKNMI